MKLKTSMLCLAFVLFGFVHKATAQNIAVTGKVKSKTTAQALSGVSIRVEGTNTATVSNEEGSFTIAGKKGAVVVFTYTGMNNYRYVLNQTGTIEINMDEAPNNLNEVIVVGYGTQKVTKVSGAISTIKSATIEKLKPVRVDEALQGTVSGVTVIQAGAPGAPSLISIRGIPSSAGSAPLIVVDGVPQVQADLNSINPADIESINVLKDAASAAIYGVKGGNGVVLVTTKAGRKNQKTVFSLNSTYGIQEVISTIPVLNAAEYGAIINEGSLASGGGIVFPNVAALGVGTDWQSQVFRRAPLQVHNLSAQGGSDKATYFLAAGYTSQGGIVGGYDKSRFNRLNLTANLNIDLTEKVKLVLNTSYQNLSSKGIQENSFNSVLGSALNYDPTVPVFNQTPNTVGQYGFSTNILKEIFNPLTKLENTYNQNIGNKLYGKIELQYQILKRLKFSSRFGYTTFNSNAKSFSPLVFWGLNNVDNSLDQFGTKIAGRFNSVAHDKATNNSFTLENFVNYDFKIKDHSFETVVGTSLQKESGNTAGASRQDVPFNSWDFADFTAATGINNSTNTDALRGYYFQYFKRNASFFARINYDYQERFLASFLIRRDGSSVFGSANKWVNLPSASLGWVVSKEKFFNSKTINFFKIRGSYGSGGIDNVQPQFRQILTDYGASLYGLGNSVGTTFGNNFVTGSTLGSLGNEELKWEQNSQLNVGFEMNMFKNKLSITADYYERRTKNLLFPAVTSLYLGTIPAPTANVGSTKSSGIDISISYNDRIGKDFKFTNMLAFTTVKNMVTATNEGGTSIIPGGGFFNGQSQVVTAFQQGFTPAYFRGFKTDGLFQSTSEIAKSARQDGAQPGDIKFVDINNDGVIDGNDRTQIGDPYPTFTIGWTLGFEYKNFDFSAFTYASVGNDIYRAIERNDNLTNKFQDVLSRWTGPGTTNDARFPRYSFTDPNNNSRVSDRYVEDGSFVKLRNLLIGYTFPTKVLGKAFKSVRIYTQVRNAFVLTKYSGYDPEIGSPGILEVGVDRGAYPLARSYAFGLDIKF